MALAKTRHYLLTLVALALCLCPTAVAQDKQSLTDLQAAGRLKIETWIEPAQAIVVNQQVNFVIEVATDQWFTGGTRIARLEIDDAIVLQREQFAVNSTRRQQGLTWSVQQWSISVYPQREGRFEIPALRLALSVAGEGGKPVIGEVHTSPVSFDASIPQALSALASAGESNTDWVAAPAFSVEESYSQSHTRELDNLQPGDAVTRTITFAAKNVAAMMLPAIGLREQEGLATYRKPPRLSDDVNRGEYAARRVETITYVLEKPGDYVLPEMSYHWWDLTSQSLKAVTLPAQRLSTPGDRLPVDAPPSQKRELKKWGSILAKFAIPLLVVSVFAMLWLRRHKAADTAERRLRKKLLQASKRGDAQQAMSFLYQWLDHYQNEHFDGSIRSLLKDLQQQELDHLFEPLMQRVYATNDVQEEADIERFVTALDDKLHGAAETHWWKIKQVSLELN